MPKCDFFMVCPDATLTKKECRIQSIKADCKLSPEQRKLRNLCMFRGECEDYHPDNQKCTDTTALCLMRVQLTTQKQAKRGVQ